MPGRTAKNHLGRWLAAYKADAITRTDLAIAVNGLVVIAEHELVEERST